MAESGYLRHQLGSPSYSCGRLDLGCGFVVWLVPKLELMTEQILVAPSHLAPNKQLLHHPVPVAKIRQHPMLPRQRLRNLFPSQHLGYLKVLPFSGEFGLSEYCIIRSISASVDEAHRRRELQVPTKSIGTRVIYPLAYSLEKSCCQ